MVSVDRAVRGYLQYLTVERGLADNTVQSYRRDLNRYLGFLDGRGRRRLTDVTAGDVAEFRGALSAGDDEHPPLASGSVGRAVVAVRGLHAFAVKQGLTAHDPAREVAPPAAATRLPKAIDVAEVTDNSNKRGALAAAAVLGGYDRDCGERRPRGARVPAVPHGGARARGQHRAVLPA